MHSYVNWVVASSTASEVFKVELGSVTETGEDIVSSVKRIAAQVQAIQCPGALTRCIHFVSDSGGAYRKARRLIKEEGVMISILHFMFCIVMNSNVLYMCIDRIWHNVNRSLSCTSDKPVVERLDVAQVLQRCHEAGNCCCCICKREHCISMCIVLLQTGRLNCNVVTNGNPLVFNNNHIKTSAQLKTRHAGK